MTRGQKPHIYRTNESEGKMPIYPSITVSIIVFLTLLPFFSPITIYRLSHLFPILSFSLLYSPSPLSPNLIFQCFFSRHPSVLKPPSGREGQRDALWSGSCTFLPCESVLSSIFCLSSRLLCCITPNFPPSSRSHVLYCGASVSSNFHIFLT